jgi:hypothetical protein
MVDADSWPPVTQRHMAVLQMNVSERDPSVAPSTAAAATAVLDGANGARISLSPTIVWRCHLRALVRLSRLTQNALAETSSSQP